VNLVLGAAYCGYGVMTAIEMKRDARTHGFSHFGMAWMCMAFTCGPHHLDHGVHAILGDHQGGFLDVFTVVVGLPVGVIWLALRIEAFLGGRGDRFIEGTPRWMQAVPTVVGIYLTALVFAVLRLTGGLRFHAVTLPNILLLGLYCEIGWVLLRTQLHNREPMGGWSLSGISLTAVFPTCALMHGIFAVYAMGGTYLHDIHGITIDWLSVPAGIYFLWVVQSLYRGTFRDWNHTRRLREAAPRLGGATP
jgi:hypothetical protein